MEVLIQFNTPSLNWSLAITIKMSPRPIIALLANQSEVITIICEYLDHRSVEWFASTSSFFSKMIWDKHAQEIYANQLCRCGRVLFSNFNELFNESDEGCCMKKFMTLCQSVSGVDVNYRSLFIEFMKGPFVFDCDTTFSEDWSNFEALGGIVMVNFANPCTFLGILFSQFYSKMQGHDLYTIHKYILINHVYPLQTVTLRFSEKMIAQPHIIGQPPKEPTMFNKMLGAVENLFKQPTFLQTITLDHEPWLSKKICTLYGAELLMAMTNNFTHYLSDRPTLTRAILHQEGRNLLDYSLMEENSSPVMLPFQHLNSYSDIFTQSSGCCYGTQPTLPDSFPSVRKYALDIEEYPKEQNERYEHLFQYNWEHIHDSFNLWSDYWLYAIEYYTYTFYNAKRNQFSVMTSNPQD